MTPCHDADRQVTLEVPWVKTFLIVRGEYTPAELGSYEDGLQMEPDVPAYFTITEVWLDDLDITDKLSNSAIAELEDLALEELTKELE